MPDPSFDADAELTALDRAAVAQIDTLLTEAIKGRGIKLPNRPGCGHSLITRPMPGDEEEGSEPPFFRVTGVDAEGSPLGHTVVTKAQYRAFRARANALHAPGRLSDVFESVRTSLRPDLVQGILGFTLGEPTQYHYRLKFREHAPGTSPREGLVAAAGRNLTFSRPLASRELADFELVPLGAERAADPTPQMAVSLEPGD